MLNRIIFLTDLMFKTACKQSILKIFMMFITALATTLSVHVMQRLVEAIEGAVLRLKDWRMVIWWLFIFTLLQCWDIVKKHADNLLQISLSKKLKENLLPAMAEKAAKIAYCHFE